LTEFRQTLRPFKDGRFPASSLQRHGQLPVDHILRQKDLSVQFSKNIIFISASLFS